MLDELERHDRVRTVRDDAARGDRHRLTRRQGTARGTAGRDFLDDRQGHSCRHVHGTDREAVHGRARKGRQVDFGRSRAGQHPAGGPLDRNALGRERSHTLENQAVRLVDGNEVGHEAVR